MTSLNSARHCFTTGWTLWNACNVLGSPGSAQVWNHWLQEAGATCLGTGACYHAGSQGNCPLVCAGGHPAVTMQKSSKEHEGLWYYSFKTQNPLPWPFSHFILTFTSSVLSCLFFVDDWKISMGVLSGKYYGWTVTDQAEKQHLLIFNQAIQK